MRLCASKSALLQEFLGPLHFHWHNISSNEPIPKFLIMHFGVFFALFSCLFLAYLTKYVLRKGIKIGQKILQKSIVKNFGIGSCWRNRVSLQILNNFSIFFGIFYPKCRSHPIRNINFNVIIGHFYSSVSINIIQMPPF